MTYDGESVMSRTERDMRLNHRGIALVIVAPARKPKRYQSDLATATGPDTLLNTFGLSLEIASPSRFRQPIVATPWTFTVVRMS